MYDEYGRHSRYELVKRTTVSFEETTSALVNQAKPFLARHQDTLERVDTLACQGLDRIESSCTKLAHAKGGLQETVHSLVSDTQRAITQLREQSVQTPAQVATVVGAHVADAVSYVSTKAYEIERVVADIAADVTERAENQLETLLPNEEAATATTATTTAAAPDNSQQPALGTETRKVADKVVELTSKVRRRLCARALRKLDAIQLRGQETVEQLRSNSVDLLNYARFELTDSVDDDAVADDGDDESSDTEEDQPENKGATPQQRQAQQKEGGRPARISATKARLFQERHPLAAFAIRVPARTTGNSARAVLRQVQTANTLYHTGYSQVVNNVENVCTGLKEKGKQVLQQPYVQDVGHSLAQSWGASKAAELHQRACVIAQPVVSRVRPLTAHAPGFVQPYIEAVFGLLEPRAATA
eukprot:m.178997 g.178997  ORF g.178997 m.178997 type:complete len:417 (-) comp17403_c6_seq1:200-1450(-)